MYDYIKGQLIELNPADVTVECSGIGYNILISLSTYSKLQKEKSECVKLFLYHYLREDDELFFGFFDKDERDVFIQLISVSGIGPNTARMMLSSMSADEIKVAIVSQDVNKIKGVKGIGLKTAQRVILELKDKISKDHGKEFAFDDGGMNTIRTEASGALILLGFSKPAVEKVLTSLFKENPDYSLEELIKKALKVL
ncbi:MAG: Holliday junction branch migration protein RuvA [Bacteroidales bacterium]|nr:Holliday junction branch migration protein RuvA [Bacteroidales bacterium]MDD3201357.1 Holliday junction branch migration protein RuvA [Bacteroidales bacterium]